MLLVGVISCIPCMMQWALFWLWWSSLAWQYVSLYKQTTPGDLNHHQIWTHIECSIYGKCPHYLHHPTSSPGAMIIININAAFLRIWTRDWIQIVHNAWLHASMPCDVTYARLPTLISYVMHNEGTCWCYGLTMICWRLEQRWESVTKLRRVKPDRMGAYQNYYSTLLDFWVAKQSSSKVSTLIKIECSLHFFQHSCHLSM